MGNITKEQARKLAGKSIYAVRKDGSVVTGKLVRIQGNKLTLAPIGKDKGKSVKTKALLPLVLFDLLAIGTLPFFGAGFGGGYGGGYGGGCGGGYGGGYGGGQCCPNQGYNYGGYY